MQPLPYSSGCFVCGHENAAGLKLRFHRRGDWVIGRCRLDSHYRGFLDRTHGGILSALVDEVMGWATVLHANRFSYTVELKVRFRQPVALEEEVEIRGRVTRHTRRLSFTEAQILDSDGGVLVSAEGKFMMVSAAASREIADQLIYDPGAWQLDDNA
jgi:acyl-coenzyme A thioesterase PaaI-like protein